MSKKREKQHKKSHSRSKIERNKQDITCKKEKQQNKGTKKEKMRQKWAERPDPDGPEVKLRKQLRRRRQREVSDSWIRMHVLNRVLKGVDSSRFTTAIQFSYPVTFDAPVIICV